MAHPYTMQWKRSFVSIFLFNSLIHGWTMYTIPSNEWRLDISVDCKQSVECTSTNRSSYCWINLMSLVFRFIILLIMCKWELFLDRINKKIEFQHFHISITNTSKEISEKFETRSKLFFYIQKVKMHNMQKEQVRKTILLNLY